MYVLYIHTVRTVYTYYSEPPNKGHFGDDINSADLFFVEFFPLWGVQMYCRNYTGTVSRVLCGEVYHTVSLFAKVDN